MVAFFEVAIAASLAIAVTASPAPPLGPLSLFRQLPKVPAGWEPSGDAPKDATVKAKIGLKQNNIQALQTKLLDISNPESKNYGKWMSRAEIDAMVAPPAENVLAVKSWLTASGITQFSQPTSDYIEFSVPLSKLESLLDTKYQTFKFKAKGNVAARTTQYSVPAALHDMIDMITPTTAFYNYMGPSINHDHVPANHTLSKRQSCDGTTITPACIDSLYNVDYTSQGSQTVASTLLINIAASHSDFQQFTSDYAPNAQDFTDVSVEGGSNPGSGSQDTLLEGNLDTQYIGGVSAPNPSQLLDLGPNGDSDEDFEDQLANLGVYLNSASSPPSSVSTSYGGEEQDFDGSYMDRVCNDFMKAGASGISVFFSAGDYGVGGNGQNDCNGEFLALWPASCPWSTAVGGTQFSNGQEVVAQYASISGSGGGGFSYHFDTPSYQQSAVTAYEQFAGSSYNGYYNPQGRGYPDVSLVSETFEVIVNGEQIGVLGTSASSPSWAALVSVLNDYRNSKGEPTLGFINPLLYSQNGSSALNDITQGNNPGCGYNGWYATTGWDAASGLGSLDFSKLRAML